MFENIQINNYFRFVNPKQVWSQGIREPIPAEIGDPNLPPDQRYKTELHQYVFFSKQNYFHFNDRMTRYCFFMFMISSNDSSCNY